MFKVGQFCTETKILGLIYIMHWFSGSFVKRRTVLTYKLFYRVEMEDVMQKINRILVPFNGTSCPV